MSFSFQAHQQAMFAHYLHLAQCPGWSDYVNAQVKAMAAEFPALYANFPAKLQQELKRIGLAQVAAPAMSSLK